MSPLIYNLSEPIGLFRIDYLGACRPRVTFMGMWVWSLEPPQDGMWDPYNYGYVSRLWNCTPNYRLATHYPP